MNIPFAPSVEDVRIASFNRMKHLIAINPVLYAEEIEYLRAFEDMTDKEIATHVAVAYCGSIASFAMAASF